MQSLDFITPFVFFFQERGWFRKFALASLLTYSLIGAAPVLGWLIVTVGRVARREQPETPQFSDWSTFWRLGGQFAAVNVLWLPVLFATLLLYLPLWLTGSMQQITLLLVLGGTLIVVVLFLLVYSLVYGFFFPAMQVSLSSTGSTWGSANPARLWKLVRPHFLQYVLVFLIVGLALFNLILVLAALTAFLLLPPLLVYAGLVSAHYAGQMERLGKAPSTIHMAGVSTD